VTFGFSASELFMVKRSFLSYAALLVGMLIMVPAASAECTDSQSTPAPEAAAAPAAALAAEEPVGDAGDDPVITQPAEPTCDDAGYTAEFPDVELATDAADTVPSQVPDTSPGGGYVPSGYLPVTGLPGLPLLLLAFAGLVLTVLGSIVHLETAKRA
jgi:hypothetical protein